MHSLWPRLSGTLLVNISSVLARQQINTSDLLLCLLVNISIVARLQINTNSVLQCYLKLSGNVSKRNKSRRDRQKAGADLSRFFEELITVDEDV